LDRDKANVFGSLQRLANLGISKEAKKNAEDKQMDLEDRMIKLLVTSAIFIVVLTIVLITPLAFAQITLPSPFRTSGNNPFVNLTPYLGTNTAASTTTAQPPQSLGPFSQLCTRFGQCSLGGGNTGAQTQSSINSTTTPD
jgi:hypothetical protein